MPTEGWYYHLLPGLLISWGMLCWVRSIPPWSLVLSLKAVFTAVSFVMATRRKVLHIQQLPDGVRTQPEHWEQHSLHSNWAGRNAELHCTLSKTAPIKIRLKHSCSQMVQEAAGLRSPQTLPEAGKCGMVWQGLAGERCFTWEQFRRWFKEHSVPPLCKAETPQTIKWNQKINKYSSTYWDMHSFF